MTEGEIPEAEAPEAIARYEAMLEGAKKELEAVCQGLEAAGNEDKTIQLAGSAPSSRAASRKISGSGLERCLSTR